MNILKTVFISEMVLEVFQKTARKFKYYDLQNCNSVVPFL